MFDARKALPVLHSEWDGCTRCTLGVYRQSMQGEMVFGEGKTRGIMFIGDAAGLDDEKVGRPFQGNPGRVLRAIIDRFQITEHYVTNIVACRSCRQLTDGGGQPLFRYDRRSGMQVPKMVDDLPSDASINACLPRLYEEIYLVDPVVIVILGGPASKALFKKNIAITKQHGEHAHISIPGAGARAVLTEKRRIWERKIHGEIALPTEPSEVRYTAIPTIHPSFVVRQIKDMDEKSLFNKLARDIRMAVRIYDRYMQEVYGTLPSREDDNDPDFNNILYTEENDE